MLKYIKTFAVALFASATLLSCSDDEYQPDPVPTPGDTEAYLSVESVSHEKASADGEEITITVKSSRVPTAKIADTWVTRKSSDRTDDIATFVFSVAPNSGMERATTITFTSGKLTTDVSIAQDGNSSVPDLPTLEDVSTSIEYAQALGLGWNLGNQFDAHSNGMASETAWGNAAATQDLFIALAQAGFRSVRIPITWLGHIGEAPDYTIDAAWLDRIAEVVDYAENAGLRAIINIHHDGADSAYWLDIKNAATDATKNAAVKAQLAAMWKQIAERFADKGQFLMFEAFNEIHDGKWGWGDNRNDGGKQYATLNEWNQTFVDAVRSTGGNNATRFLGIPGYCTNPSLTIDNLVLPDDTANDRLLVAVHFYDPSTFAIEAKYTEWGHTGTAGKKDTWGDENNVTDTFASLTGKFTGRGIYVGEFGATTRADARAESFRLYYLEYVCRAAADKDIALFFWDNGSAATGKEAFGLFNHATGSYIGTKSQPAVKTMVRGYYNDDPAYTLQTVYDNAPM